MSGGGFLYYSILIDFFVKARSITWVKNRACVLNTQIPKKQLLDILAVVSYKVAKVLRSGWMQLAFVFFVLNYDSCSCRLLFLLINVSLTLSSHYCWTHVCWSGGLSQVSDILFSKSDGTQTQASLWYGPSSSLYFFCFLSFALCSFGNIFCKSCTLEV